MASSELITLRGGVVASIEALRVLWSLEDRGFQLEPAGGGLKVQPVTALTSADVAAIRQHRDELLMLVRYCLEVALA